MPLVRAGEIRCAWDETYGWDALPELAALSRMGEAVRGVDRRGTARPAYEDLFRIGCLGPSYEVRVGVAQEIGADSAFWDLEQRLGVLRSVGELRVDHR